MSDQTVKNDKPLNVEKQIKVAGDDLLLNLRITDEATIQRLKNIVPNGMLGKLVQEKAYTNLVFYLPNNQGGYDCVIKLFRGGKETYKEGLPKEAWALKILQDNGFDTNGEERISIPGLQSVDHLNQAIILSPVTGDLSEFDSSTFLKLMADGLIKFAGVEDPENIVPTTEFDSIAKSIELIDQRLGFFYEFINQLEDGLGSNPTEIHDYEILGQKMKDLDILDRVNRRVLNIKERLNGVDMQKKLNDEDLMLTPGDLSNLNAVFRTTTQGEPGICFLDPELLHKDYWQFVVAMYVQNPSNLLNYSSEEKRVELMRGFLNDFSVKFGADKESLETLNNMLLVGDLAWLASYLKSFPLGYKDILAHDDRFRNRAHFLYQELLPYVDRLLNIDPEKLLLDPNSPPKEIVLKDDENIVRSEFPTPFGRRAPVTQYEIYASNLMLARHFSPEESVQKLNASDIAFPFDISEMCDNSPFVTGKVNALEDISDGYCLVTMDVYSSEVASGKASNYKFLAEKTGEYQKTGNMAFIVGDKNQNEFESVESKDESIRIDQTKLKIVLEKARKLGIGDTRHLEQFAQRLERFSGSNNSKGNEVVDFQIYDSSGYFTVVVAEFKSGEKIPVVINYLGVDDGTSSAFFIEDKVSKKVKMVLKSRVIPPTGSGNKTIVESCRSFADRNNPFAEVSRDMGIRRSEFVISESLVANQEWQTNSNQVGMYRIQVAQDAGKNKWVDSDLLVATGRSFDEVRVRDFSPNELLSAVRSGDITDNFTLAMLLIYGAQHLTEKAKGKVVYLQKTTMLSAGGAVLHGPRTPIGIGEKIGEEFTNTGAGDSRKKINISKQTPSQYLENRSTKAPIVEIPMDQIISRAKKGEFDIPTMAMLFIGMVNNDYIEM